MLFSNASNLPHWARPFLDGLLALNIDLAMDVIAIRLGLWSWDIDPTSEYFGVPFANFWAWYWVIFSFSAATRILVRLLDWDKPWKAFLGSLGAILLGTLGVLASNILVANLASNLGGDQYVLTLVACLGAVIGTVIVLRSRFDWKKVNFLTASVPLTFHVYFLIAGVLSGAIFNPPMLIFICLLMLLISLLLHFPRLLLSANRKAI
jgi:uncharacterized membrane protein YeaQ/YmgE (transglycosylase-associated protein family)